MIKGILYIALGIFICYMWSDNSADSFKNDMRSAMCNDYVVDRRNIK